MDIAIASAMLAEWELGIEVDLVHTNGAVYAVLITTLFDSRSEMTWRPEEAVVAVGEYLEGPRAGEPVIIENPDVEELRLHVH